MRRLTTLKRILSYTSTKDRVFLATSFIASVCAGATLPLMNLVFGKQTDRSCFTY